MMSVKNSYMEGVCANCVCKDQAVLYKFNSMLHLTILFQHLLADAECAQW